MPSCFCQGTESWVSCLQRSTCTFVHLDGFGKPSAAYRRFEMLTFHPYSLTAHRWRGCKGISAAEPVKKGEDIKANLRRRLTKMEVLKA